MPIDQLSEAIVSPPTQMHKIQTANIDNRI